MAVDQLGSGVRNMTVRRPASCLPLASEDFALLFAQLTVLPPGPSHQALPSVRETVHPPMIDPKLRRGGVKQVVRLVTNASSPLAGVGEWLRPTTGGAAAGGHAAGDASWAASHSAADAAFRPASPAGHIALPPACLRSSRLLPGTAVFLEVAAVVLTPVSCRYRHTQVAAIQATTLGTWPGATATSEAGTAHFSNRYCRPQMARGARPICAGRLRFFSVWAQPATPGRSSEGQQERMWEASHGASLSSRMVEDGPAQVSACVRALVTILTASRLC